MTHAPAPGIGGFAPDEGQVDELKIELSPRLSTLSSLQDVIEEFGNANDVPDGTIFLVSLELDELLTNYVRHSLHHVQRPRMQMRVRLFPEKLVLSVVDTGPPFDPRSVPPPDTSLGVEDREIGGVGLHLVRSYCDKMVYQSVRGCNYLQLEHHLDP